MKNNMLFAEKTLESLINIVKISENEKEKLIKNLPLMNAIAREDLYYTLKELCILDVDEEIAVSKMEKYQKRHKN